VDFAHLEILKMRLSPWWRGAVIYQIYPRSFLDFDLDHSVLAFTRATADERLLIVLNLSRTAVAFAHDMGELKMLNVPAGLKESIEGAGLRIPGSGAIFASVT
jgi:glycosidase